MHIGLIGGIERGGQRFASLAREQGHSFEFHGGDMAGRGGASLRALLERADVVVIITEVNSHAAVLSARSQARSLGKRCLLVRRFGFSRFRELLAKVNQGGAFSGVAA